ncbi:hypothetical protein [Mobilicoccus massiliensis]|uniref:hypothetical protein n=1 Tax=Mobilicoccus massiliensis TaxID=1522310 RepID=UPI0006942E24|nr:hypothetical protein [Mobilicoccus massiliensis]
MPELPASVRLALWATSALAGGEHGRGEEIDHGAAVAAAAPDLPDVDDAAALARLDLWAQLGERVVLVSLPAPGDLVGLPRGDATFVGAAVEAGECVWSSLFGGALVPVYETFGPADDEGLLLRWEAHECAPPPSHLQSSPSPAEIERGLREVTATAVRALEDLDSPAWRAGLRDVADERLQAGRWGLPDGLGPRVRRVIVQAATIGTIATTALERLDDVPSVGVGANRDRILREVQFQARRALAAGACAASMELAEGDRGSR